MALALVAISRAKKAVDLETIRASVLLSILSNTLVQTVVHALMPELGTFFILAMPNIVALMLHILPRLKAFSKAAMHVVLVESWLSSVRSTQYQTVAIETLLAMELQLMAAELTPSLIAAMRWRLASLLLKEDK